MLISGILQMFLLTFGLLIGACALLDEGVAKKPAATGLIATPPTYYSTAKAKYLGTKYKENLDRLVERITRNSKTAPLQFANNISSVGGIGFFTHSATKTADERYLEVVLATPDTFENKGEHSAKVQRLFSRYGLELLGILSADNDIYQDKELNGYGLNLAWRNLVSEAAGSRVMLERAIIYFPKERVRNFTRHEIKQDDLLADAVIFAVEEDGPLNLVSFRPQEVRPDFRPAIREDNLTAAPPLRSESDVARVPAQEINAPPRAEPGKSEPAPAANVKPAPREVKSETKSALAAGQKTPPIGAKAATPSTTMEAPKPAQRAPAEAVAINRRTESSSSLTESVESTRAQPDSERSPLPPKAAPNRSLPATAASNDQARAEKPEEGHRESIDIAAPKPTVADKPAVAIAAPVVKAPAPLVPQPARMPTPTPAAASAEKDSPTKQPATENVPPTSAPQPLEVKGREVAMLAPPAAKVPEPTLSVEIAKPTAAVNVAKIETTPSDVTAPPPALMRPKQETLAAPKLEAKAAGTPRQATVTIPPVSVSTVNSDPTPIEAKSAPLALPTPKADSVAVPVVKPVPAVRPVEVTKPAPPIIAAKTETPAAEQLALLTNKPVEVAAPKPMVARPAAKPLEGFIIQLAFSDKEKAQRWAESMEKRGYAVSLTEAGAEGSLRVRVGNFSGRDDAERQLRTFKQEGMNGIIINLPQAYRPEARSSIP